VLLEHPAHLDGLRRRVAAVGVYQQCHVVTEGRAYRTDDLLRAPGPLVLVVAELLSDPDLERVEPFALVEPDESIGLVLGRDVASHARAVGAHLARPAADELAHALPLELPAEIPEGGVQAGEGAVEV